MSTAPTTISDPTADTPRVSHRIPLSLRLFAAMLVLSGVGSGLWIGIPVYRQQVAIQEIDRLGGSIDKRKVSMWLRDLIDAEGMKIFDDVWLVDLNGTQAADATLGLMDGMTRLEFIGLHDTLVTDAGLGHLSSLTKIETVYLSDTSVTDAGLVHLSRLTNLGFLDIHGTAVSDAGLVHLSKLANLRVLHLQDTAVTDRGVDNLQKCLPDCSIWR